MADAKITALTSATGLSQTDLVAVVTDPGGTPATKKATQAVLLTSRSGGGDSSFIGQSFGASANSAWLSLQKSRNATFGSHTVVSSGDELGQVRFYGSDGSAYVVGAAIVAAVDGTPGANDMPGRLLFYTTPDGSASVVERMRITNGGLVGIGITPTSDAMLQVGGVLRVGAGNANGQLRLGEGVSGGFNVGVWRGTVNSTSDGNYLNLGGYDGIIFAASNAAVGSQAEGMRLTSGSELWIGYTSDNGAYKLQVNSQIFATNATIATSDARYKEHVEDLTGGLELVRKLHPVSFDWKEQKPVLDKDGTVLREPHNFAKGRQVGFLAQDVQKAWKDQPWLGGVIAENRRAAIERDGEVVVPEEPFLGMSHDALIPVLVSAVQELTAKVEALEKKLAAKG